MKKNKMNKLTIDLIIWGTLSSLFVIISYVVIWKIWFPEFIIGCEGQNNCGWDHLEGFTSLITLSLLLGGFVFAIREYYRQENQISFQIYESIHKKLTDPEEEAARRWIYEEINPPREDEDKEKWINKVEQKIHDPSGVEAGELPIGRKSLKRILNSLDYFGFLTENYVSVKKPFLRWMSAPVAKMWERIETYVIYEKNERNEKDYYESAFYIGKLCVDYRRDNELDSEKFKGAT
jgi:hypothetical protein